MNYEIYDRAGVNSGNSHNGSQTRTLHTEYGDLQLSMTQEKRYVCVYIDATYIPVKLATVAKEGVYIAVGIRKDGSKEVLTYAIAPTESAYIWKELLQEVKKRGMQQILLFISDGLIRIVNAIKEV